MTISECISGIWYFSAQSKRVIDSIMMHGWKPDLVNNTIYGTAIYLARANWYSKSSASQLIACLLSISLSKAKMAHTSKEMGTGISSKHLREYWREIGVPCHKTPQKGTDQANLQRRNHFLSTNIKVIFFEEYKNVLVAAVYDPINHCDSGQSRQRQRSNMQCSRVMNKRPTIRLRRIGSTCHASWPKRSSATFGESKERI